MLRSGLATILLGVLAVEATLAQPVVTVEGATSTQAVLSYLAPDDSACTVKVSESAGLSPVAHDVDPALFAGADQDLSRPTTVVNGLQRTVTVGARTSDKGLDGRMYSRALQTFTPHYFVVTCSSGAASGSFVTANIPLGNTFPEVPPFHPDGFGNYAWPTVDWLNPATSYLDPMTGVLVKMAYPLPARQGNSRWGSDNSENPFALALDINGAWTNINNILNTSTSGPFASYSGTNSDPVFLAFPEISGAVNLSGWGSGVMLDDVRLTLYGSGSGGSTDDRTVLACLSIDSGQTCSSQEIPIVLPTGSGTSSAPGSYPSMQFQGWPMSLPPRKDQTAIPAGKVNVSDKTVTLTTTDYASQFFPTTWAAGTRIYIAGSAPGCPNNHCTIASLQNATQLTIQESAGTLTGANYRGAGFGLRIRKQTGSGSVGIGSSFAYAWSFGPAMPLNGVADFCSNLTTTVSYAADGATPIDPVQGRLCVLQTTPYFGEAMLVLLIESTGEVRTLSDFYFSMGPNGGWRSGYAVVPYGAFSPTDALTVQTVAPDNSGCVGCPALYRITYNADLGKFKQWAGSNYNYSARPNDYLTWTNLTPYGQNKGIQQQIGAAITANPFYDPSMTINPAYVGIVGNYVLFNLSLGGGQDAPCFVIRLSMADGTVSQIADTFGGSSPTGRWAGCHSVQTMGAGDWTMILASLLNKQSSSAYLGGPFEVRQVSQVFKNGSWNSDTSIGPSEFYACTPGNPYEAKGATGNNCLKVRITGEPCSAYATTLEKQKYPCSWDSNRSMPQTLLPGDYLWTINSNRDFNGKNEKMLVVSKTDIGGGGFELETMRMATCRGVLYYDDTAARTHGNGWTAMMSGTGLCAGNGWWISAADQSKTWYVEDSALTMAHGTFGSGKSSDRYTMVAAGAASRFSQPVPEQFGKPPMYAQSMWSSSFGGITRQAGVDIQSYPNKGQWKAPESEQAWALDLRHYNPSGGYGAELPSGLWSQTYSLVSGTTEVYKIDNAGVYGKVLPYFAWAGAYLLKDMSGPNSLITDAEAWRFCVALRSGECRPGSSVNDTFVNVPKASISTSCVVNQYTRNYPCFTNGYSFGAWITQFDVSRDDPAGVNTRRLSMGFTGPGRQYQFANVHTTPEGKWAFFGPGWIDGVRPDLLLMKLPPWPNAQQDGTRSGFVTVQVDLPANPQYTKARVRFGYAENGPVSSFFCTSRQEACVTDTQLTPFAYAQTETSTPVACQEGCSLSIPAIPGRVLYYRIERLNDNPSDVFQEPANVRVVP